MLSTHYVYQIMQSFSGLHELHDVACQTPPTTTPSSSSSSSNLQFQLHQGIQNIIWIEESFSSGMHGSPTNLYRQDDHFSHPKTVPHRVFSYRHPGAQLLLVLKEGRWNPLGRCRRLKRFVWKISWRNHYDNFTENHLLWNIWFEQLWG